MEKHGQDQAQWQHIRKYMVLITYAILLLSVVYHFEHIYKKIIVLINVLVPLFWGIVLAFIFHIPLEFFQFKVMGRWERHPRLIFRRLWKGISLLFTYLSVFLVIIGLGTLILPALTDSVTTLAANLSTHLPRFRNWADERLASLAIIPDIRETLVDMGVKVAFYIQQLIGRVLRGAVGFTSGIFNILLGLMLSGFILYNREVLFSQFKRLATVVLGSKRTGRLSEIIQMVDNVFGRFITGQLIEASILGILCFLGMNLFGMHYALLISAIIAVTSLIPILGPIIGTIPCALILLVIDPMQALWFGVLIIVLQQIEGDFIYPRIVGTAVGLPGLWVLISILVGGGLFGVWGMLLGTPVTALGYRLIGQWVRSKEQERLE